MRVAVASGKGGTGKSCVAASLALSSPDVLAVDLDVEEPNLALILDRKSTRLNSSHSESVV